ncbi:MAG TPA: NUDIX domain-containing protein [Acidimicrobiales bacterium]|nr:NUDIX domain-containing protein [Acidimicrobiales bacterium]
MPRKQELRDVSHRPLFLVISTIKGFWTSRQVDDYAVGVAQALRKTAAITVDLVVLTVRNDELVALVVKRGVPPYRGRWALPGGFVDEDEDLPDAAARELEEETGIAADVAHLEQLATYGAPRRDPRGRVVSTAYLALLPDLPSPTAGSDAAGARWLPIAEALDEPTRLAFDHHMILGDGVERARAKLEYSPLAAAFCGDLFTIAELRRVYEAVWGTSLDPRNFHRKVTTTPGFVQATAETTTRDGGRPAQLYTRGDAGLLHPAMLRPR